MAEADNMKDVEEVEDPQSSSSIPSPAAWQKKPYEREDMRAFEMFDYPIWCFDVEKKCMWWANKAALALWEAASLEDLLARDFSNMSESTVQRLSQLIYNLSTGKHMREQWTFYPQGKPTTVDATVYGWPIADQATGSRLAMLVHGRKVDSDEIKQETLRAVEAVRHLPSPVIQFTRAGDMIYHNSVAIKIFGPTINQHNVMTLFVDSVYGQAKITELYEESQLEAFNAELITVDGPRMYMMNMKLLADPITGEKHTLWNMRDITMEENLKVAKEEAEKASKTKSEFLAMISHELRTPLHGMLGFAELLEVTNLDETQREYLRTMQASASSLMSVISDLLDFSKIESGKVELETMEFELESVIQDSVNCIAAQARDKQLDVRLLVPDELKDIKVNGDPFRIRQILINLLSNAVKFTSQGHVSLSVAKLESPNARTDDREMLRFTVEDTGIGIPNDAVTTLFERFSQVDSSVSRRFGGTGLGLAICRLLANIMNGKIGVKSQAGAGSTFWVDLPLTCFSRKRPSSTAGLREGVGNGSSMHLMPVSHKKKRMKKRKSSDRSPLAIDSVGDSSPDANNSPAVVGSLRILVAEDNPVNRSLIEVVLRKLGHDSFMAQDGEVAVALARQRKFDLVLMDIQMPKNVQDDRVRASVMDGFQATRAIRQLQDWQEVPIIGLTAGYVKDNAKLYTDAGLTDCIAKPFRVQELERVIDTWVHKR